MDQFLSEATNIPNTYTPAGRTFVSWTSTLTGTYPITHNARFNLTEMSKVDRSLAFPQQLSSIGYQNIWAQDERRFNNIDESFGFDIIVGPPADAAEFIVSGLNNIPLFSLFLNQTSIRSFFPYIYNNRSAWWTYQPYAFIEQLLGTIDSVNSEKPIFLATHLTLPHWPFKSAKLTYLEDHEFIKDRAEEYLYLTMLKQSDEQFAQLLNGLADRGILQNSVVVLLSDHGESFGGKDDGPQGRISSATFETNSLGHGTNVLSHSQFKVVAAVRSFSNGVVIPAIDPKSTYSLVDIIPSLANILEIKVDHTFDGKPFHQVSEDRAIFLESSLNPLVLSAGKLEVIQTLAKGLNFYTVDESGKVIIKPEIFDSSIAAKQRSIIKGNYQLAAFPDMEDELIFVDLETNYWQPASTVKDKVKIRTLFFALCDFYETDVSSGLFESCQEPEIFLERIYDKWN
ncbi:DUF229 domain-containing protein [Shewanella maritima]|uniref:DUF229 domain-containing protein n=1 Tax=Shewanella maritima TaxID=2520507 RepID=A0A411PIS7_9GAMM|nr:DUF229 domain-containing protein [Shewanella maritima]